MSIALILRRTRLEHGISQLELAGRLDVSQRHISFLESGRALPSRSLILAWMAELGVPVSVRNAALLQCGFALPQPDEDTQGAEATLVREAVRRTLEAHLPHPGLAFDADWKTVEQNRGARWLSSVVMPGLWRTAGGGGMGLDIITAIGHPQGLLSRACEPESTAAALLTQLRAETWSRPALASRVEWLARALERRYPGRMPERGRAVGVPYFSFVFDTEFGALSFEVMQSVFALPQDVTPASLRVEMWFPRDRATAEAMARHVPLQPAAQVP